MNENSLKLTMEALEKIKEVCTSVKDNECHKCLFQSGGECSIANIDINEYGKLPCNWEVRTETIIKV